MSIFLPIMNDYRIRQTIGKGAYGKVKLAVEYSSGREVAIKIICKKNLSAAMEACIRLEIHALQTLNHQHICQLFDVVESHEAFFMILEHVSGGDLFDFIVSKDFISEEEARPIFLQIAQTLAYVHEMGFAHRDIKPENILIDENNHIKLIDFGLCAYPKEGMESLLTTRCGSPLYTAPEVVLGTPYLGAKADMWSMGMLLHIMLTGRIPFAPRLHIDVIRHMMNTGLVNYLPSTTEEAIDLITGLMKVDPEQRLSIDDVINHPWMDVNNNTNNDSSFLTSAHELAQKLHSKPHPLNGPKALHNNVPIDDNNNADVSVSMSPRVPDINKSVTRDFSGSEFFPASFSTFMESHNSRSLREDFAERDFQIDDIQNSEKDCPVAPESIPNERRAPLASTSEMNDFGDNKHRFVTSGFVPFVGPEGCKIVDSGNRLFESTQTPTSVDGQTTKIENVDEVAASCIRIPNFRKFLNNVGTRMNRLFCVLPSGPDCSTCDEPRTVKRSRKLCKITQRGYEDLLDCLKQSLVQKNIPHQQSGYTMTCTMSAGVINLIFTLEVVNVIHHNVVKSAVSTKRISGSKMIYNIMCDEITRDL